MGLPNTVESIALLASPSSYSPRFWSLPSCVVQQVLLDYLCHHLHFTAQIEHPASKAAHLKRQRVTVPARSAIAWIDALLDSTILNSTKCNTYVQSLVNTTVF